jgi:hypothetical protein
MKKLSALTAAALILAAPLHASAAQYADVSAGHWARTYVDKVSSAGIMVADAAGRFNPDQLVDKFEASKTLAVMAGYKYSGRSAQEQTYYDGCYSKWKGFINQYVNKFKKWNGTMDREIAFLLEKGVLATTDLDQFVVVDGGGAERVRALSRQDAAVFITRVMGKEKEAAGGNFQQTFADNAKISASARPCVYYLKSIGVFSVDGSNSFNPAGSMSRAMMAVAAAKAMDVISPPVSTPAPAQTPAPTAQPTPAPAPITAYTPISGTLTKIYDSFSAIQISGIGESGATKIYAVAANAIIKIDGYTKAFKDLREGLTVTCALSGQELVTVNAVSASAPAPSPVPSASPAPSYAPVPAPAAPAAAERSSLEGTVAAVRTDGSGNYVSIEVRILTPKGTVYSETRSFIVPSGCPVERGGKASSFLSIVKGDIITAEVAGATAYSINLEEKNREFAATLTDKKTVAETGAAILAVKDGTGKTSEFRVTSDSYIYRKGVGVVAWSELRLGDSLDIRAEYDKIVEIYAYGSRRTDDVTVKEIFISETEQCRVTVTGSDGKTVVYPIIRGMLDPYGLRAGARYRLALDSNEAEAASLIQNYVLTQFTGFISSIGANRVTVRDAAGVEKQFSFDAATSFTDSVTGRSVTGSYLTVNMKVSVSAAPGSSAKAVYVLGY